MAFTSDQDEHLSFIRHELKNPLSTVKMITYIVSKKAKESGNNELLEHVDKLDKKIDDIVEMVDKLLRSEAK